MGYDVIFISGSDMHGTPIVLSAETQGIAPESVVERFHD
jgi:methionyl-tRNA synthetase